MTFSRINKALDTILYNYASANNLTVAWRNIEFQPGTATYFRPSILPADTTPVGVEFTGSEDFSGVYQVDVVLYKGSTTIQERIHVDGICTAFARGTEATISGQKIQVTSVSPGPALELDANWYYVPVSVNYRTFA